MIVTFISGEYIRSLSLPQKVGGRFGITADGSDTSPHLADVEGIQNQWYLHSSPMLTLLDQSGREAETIALTGEKCVLGAKFRETGVGVRFYIDPSDAASQVYRKFCVGSQCRLNIGRAADNQIVFNNEYVSSHHACLIWRGDHWNVTDTQSRNGTFVNQRRIATRELDPGDTIYIMGLKIIVGAGFFGINDPEGSVSISSESLAELARQEVSPSAKDPAEEPDADVFSRSPRLYRELPVGRLRVDGPPPADKQEDVSTFLTIGPAVTMGMSAMVMGAIAGWNYYVGDSELITVFPTIVMSLAMLCGMLVWPQLTRASEKKKKAAAEKLRQGRYREYLDGIQSEIYHMEEEQKKVLLENCPGTAECADRILRRKHTLWERSAEEKDFLHLRLGLGNVPLQAEIKFPEKRFSLENDFLQNELNRLADLPMLIKDAPIVCPAGESAVIGIVGGPEEAESFLRDMVLQIVALHSYEEVKLIFLVDKYDREKWDFARFLPHIWSADRETRYFAADPTEVRSIALLLERIVQKQMEKKQDIANLGKQAKADIHYVMIVPSVETAESEGLFAKLRSFPTEAGISCITMAPRLTALPKECTAVIELAGERSALLDRRQGTRTAFRLEEAPPYSMPEIARTLANLAADSQTGQAQLPSLLTFLELYGVGKVEHLNALTRWKENSPVNSLGAPVGVREDGTTFSLDLHERSHGPHGLVAGMTGSGKSEFVITYILSMAINYHPDEVAFILIDYKGGGLAGAFEDAVSGVKIPHLAGTITNLDGSAVNRALISIQSELRRRQAIFNEARRISGQGTVDIYKYQKMYRSGLVGEPVPHLFVVSDEFAELKAQQPEFMSQLISAARIGRSLGVHLILATQKPSGVVDDQIWSNSRFRVCLKVQERADSMEMLKRPDAAELRETGRFYLQVGFNELFELGQSAWCGAPYQPSDRIQKNRDESIEVIDNLGHVLLEAKKQEAAGRDSGVSQVVSIVKYLSDLAQEEKIGTRQLWLPQIPELIYLDELVKKYGWSPKPLELEPIIGEYDDPANQAQGLLTLPFTREGNTLLYGSTGSGKNTFLNTVLAGLLQNYTAEQLNVYIMDFGEETLRIFMDAPQVGDVLFSGDEEKVQNLFKLLESEIRQRKKKFVEGDGSYQSFCKTPDQPIPQILVILRNYTVFSEQFEALEEKLIQIVRDSSKYGIYFLMTAGSAGAVRYRMAQNFPNVYVLQLNDADDYVGLLGRTEGVYPSKRKGSGIFRSDKVYEFQTAHFAKDYSQKAIRILVDSLSREAKVKTPPIPILPKRVTPSFFQEEFGMDAVPVGVVKSTLKPAVWNMEESVATLVLSQNTDELTQTAQGITEQAARRGRAVTVLDGADLIEESTEADYRYISGSFTDTVEAIFSEMVRRNNTYKAAASAKEELPDFDPRYIIVTGLRSIFDGLSADGRDKLGTLMEKAQTAYHVYFILCDTEKSISSFKADAWYQAHVKETEGIWVGDGITDQYLLKLGRLGSALYSDIPPRFGYLVRRGKPTLAKLIVGEREEEEAVR